MMLGKHIIHIHTETPFAKFVRQFSKAWSWPIFLAYFDICMCFIFRWYSTNQAFLLFWQSLFFLSKIDEQFSKTGQLLSAEKICLSAEQTIQAKRRQTHTIFPICELCYFFPVGCASGKIVYSHVALIPGPEYFWIYHFYCLLYWITVKEKNTFVRIQNQNTLRAFRIYL